MTFARFGVVDDLGLDIRVEAVVEALLPHERGGEVQGVAIGEFQLSYFGFW